MSDPKRLTEEDLEMIKEGAESFGVSDDAMKLLDHIAVIASDLRSTHYQLEKLAELAYAAMINLGTDDVTSKGIQKFLDDYIYKETTGKNA